MKDQRASLCRVVKVGFEAMKRMSKFSSYQDILNQQLGMVIGSILSLPKNLPSETMNEIDKTLRSLIYHNSKFDHPDDFHSMDKIINEILESLYLRKLAESF